MKFSPILTLILFSVFQISVFAQSPSGQFKVRNDAFIQIGYSGYKTLTFGQEANTPNNGRFAFEYCATCSPTGFNIWKPWPTWLAANYLLYIRDNGNIGIGNVGDANFKLDVSGSVRCIGLTNLSDHRLKQNIITLNSTLANLNKIKLYEYQFKQGLDIHPKNEDEINLDKSLGAKNLGLDNKKHYGVMAHELEKIYPDLVTEDENGYKSVNYIEIIPILIKSIQELDSKVNEQERIIQKLVNKK
jgi:hypothetical protein